MKTKSYILTALASSVLALAPLASSCSSELDEQNPVNSETQVDENGKHTVKLHFNVSKTPFDGIATTRSADKGWEDKDIVFLIFTRANGETTNGHAMYDATKQEWSVNFELSLAKDQTTACKAYYIDGVKAVDSILVAKTIQVLPTMGVYSDENATYFYPTNGTLEVTANLTPLTSRIRFKDNHSTIDTETQYIMSKVKHITSFDKEKMALTEEETSVHFRVNKDGYTDYLYGTCADNTNRTMRITSPDCNYTTEFESDMFVVGKSGWMDLPNPISHNGWKQEWLEGTVGSHDYVDLGLPSGLKWAKTNVGGTVETDAGDKFYCGAITTSGSYSNSTTSISGNASYDAARAIWGETWRMPTKEEFLELRDNCSISYNISGSYNGTVFTGPNGKSIYIKAYTYWTATPNNSSSAYKYYIYNNRIPETYWDTKSYTYYIRPVTN